MPTKSSPNWSSILTGAYPEDHGIHSNQWCVSADPPSPIPDDILRNNQAVSKTSDERGL